MKKREPQVTAEFVKGGMGWSIEVKEIQSGEIVRNLYKDCACVGLDNLSLQQVRAVRDSLNGKMSARQAKDIPPNWHKMIGEVEDYLRAK